MAADFKTNYLAAYEELMAKAIATGTPYDKSITYLKDEFDNLGISDKEKAMLTAQFIANITTSITNNAMQIALGLTDKDLKATLEIDIMTAQKEKVTTEKDVAVALKTPKINSDTTIMNNNALKSTIEKDIAEGTKADKIAMATKQLNSLQANIDYTTEKQTQLTNSVKFNNYSKALDYFSEAYGQHKLGGGTITSSMWEIPLTLARKLGEHDLTTTTLSTNTVTSE